MQHKNIRIADFEPGHYWQMLPRIRAADALDLQGLGTAEMLAAWQEGRTVYYRDEIMALYGAGMQQGVGHLWTVTTDLVERCPLFVTRIGRSLVRSLFRRGCHRVEAFCHAGNERSLRWLTRGLGFRVEGLLRRSGANAQDRFILSIIEEEAR